MSQSYELPEHTGPAPRVNPGDDAYPQLADWLLALDHVEEGRSRVSLPSSRAAWINEAAINPIAQREFAHIHTEPGPGSRHMPLPRRRCRRGAGQGLG